ncbi:MAG: WecB/TagA/CpsF family glycosyltransferase [Candidatus Hydrogenedentes bacterium]|nr:WecB/TagA/CpsF family glycosyltransferase [Candidatus Hydrogenedentota bacterium]
MGLALRRTPLKDRVAGVALMYDLLSAADERRLRVYFLGAGQEVLDSLKEVCARDFPGLKIVGTRNGYFDESAWPELVSEIRDSRADMLFVGMPTPFKEVWCHEHKDALDVPVIMGVGGSFDVVAGYVRRAPTVMQNMGLEWFWRLLMEPRRMWKRYLSSNTAFLWLTFRSMLHNRLSPKTH